MHSTGLRRNEYQKQPLTLSHQSSSSLGSSLPDLAHSATVSVNKSSQLCFSADFTQAGHQYKGSDHEQRGVQQGALGADLPRVLPGIPADASAPSGERCPCWRTQGCGRAPGAMGCLPAAPKALLQRLAARTHSACLPPAAGVSPAPRASM